MARVELTKGQVALVDDQDLELVSARKWSAMRDNQRAVKYYAVSGRLLMHRLIMGAEKGQYVDHINGDTLDNRRANLRWATISQNTANRVNLRPGWPRGVYPRKSPTKPWYSTIRVNNKLIYLGAFKTVQEAADARNKEAVKHFGPFARTDVTGSSTR